MAGVVVGAVTGLTPERLPMLELRSGGGGGRIAAFGGDDAVGGSDASVATAGASDVLLLVGENMVGGGMKSVSESLVGPLLSSSNVDCGVSGVGGAGSGMSSRDDWAGTAAWAWA